MSHTGDFCRLFHYPADMKALLRIPIKDYRRKEMLKARSKSTANSGMICRVDEHVN
jgi:hypothetical protein